MKGGTYQNICQFDRPILLINYWIVLDITLELVLFDLSKDQGRRDVCILGKPETENILREGMSLHHMIEHGSKAKSSHSRVPQAKQNACSIDESIGLFRHCHSLSGELVVTNP